MRVHEDRVRDGVLSSISERDGDAILPDPGHVIPANEFIPRDIDIASGDGPGLRASAMSAVRERAGGAVLPDLGYLIRSSDTHQSDGFIPRDIDIASGDGHGMRVGRPSSIRERGGDAVLPDHGCGRITIPLR
jgi:hypothetical protein